MQFSKLSDFKTTLLISPHLDEKARVALKESSLKGQELISRAASNDDFRRKQSIMYQKMNPVQVL